MTEPQPPQPPPAALPSDVRNWAMAAHLSAFALFVTGIGLILGPLLVWLFKREQHPFIDEHGKEALNFNISIAIYGLVSMFLMLLLVGFLLILAVGIVWVILTIIAGVKAANGEAYRYPLTIRFVS